MVYYRFFRVYYRAASLEKKISSNLFFRIGKKSLFTSSEDQGMYKNRVENNRKILKIIALLYWERGNSAENGAGKFKIYMLF